MLTVTVIDKWSPGKVTQEWALDVFTERITVRELNRLRIYSKLTTAWLDLLNASPAHTV